MLFRQRPSLCMFGLLLFMFVCLFGEWDTKKKYDDDVWNKRFNDLTIYAMSQKKWMKAIVLWCETLNGDCYHLFHVHLSFQVMRWVGGLPLISQVPWIFDAPAWIIGYTWCHWFCHSYFFWQQIINLVLAETFPLGVLLVRLQLCSAVDILVVDRWVILLRIPPTKPSYITW